MKLPQLSLRELFWLVLVCALALGWWLDRGKLNAQLQEYQTEEAIRQIHEAIRKNEVRAVEWQPPPGTLRDGFQLDAF